MDWREDYELKLFITSMIEKSLSNKDLLTAVEDKFPSYTWSLPTLKKRLKDWGIRRTENVSVEDCIRAVEIEIQRAGRSAGYREIWRRVRQNHHLLVTRNQVYTVLKDLCPEEMEERRPRRKNEDDKKPYLSVVGEGVNFCWSMGVYNKLQGLLKNQFPFGVFSIIDAYSQKALCLCVSRGTNDPDLIGNYFLNVIQTLNVIPRVVRTDDGIENTKVHQIQQFLRCEDLDEQANNCVLVGPSIPNQVIYHFWDILRGLTEQFLQEFKALHKCGVYSPEVLLHKHVLFHVYQPLIQKELDKCKEHWNSQLIRKQDIDHPCRTPEVLFISGHQCGVKVDENRMAFVKEKIQEVDVLYCPETVRAACYQAIPLEDISLRNAKETYKRLIDALEALPAGTI